MAGGVGLQAVVPTPHHVEAKRRTRAALGLPRSENVVKKRGENAPLFASIGDHQTSHVTC
jgi:hypothetical protein